MKDVKNKLGNERLLKTIQMDVHEKQISRQITVENSTPHNRKEGNLMRTIMFCFVHQIGYVMFRVIRFIAKEVVS